MTTATYTNPPSQPGVVRVRAGRLGLLLVVLLAVLAGGGFLVLATYGKKVVPAPVERLVQPSWITEAVAYPVEERAAAPAAAPPERNAELLRQLATLHQEVRDQRAALEAIKTRPAPAARPGEGRPGPPGPHTPARQTARVDALCQSRPQGGGGRAESQ